MGVIGLVALLAWSVGWDAIFADRDNPQTQDAYADGSVRPLGARVAGYVTRSLVQDNQPVLAGQLLMTIEDDQYRAALARAEAQLGADAALLAALDAQRRAAQDAIGEAGDLAGGSASRAAYAAEDAARRKRLLSSELGLLQAAQMSEAALRIADAQTRRGESEIALRRADLALLQARTLQARAQQALDQASLAQAQLDLDYTRIRAPVAGLLGVRQVHVGDLISAGRELIELEPFDDVWVTAYFSERQLDHVRPGQAAQVRLDAFPSVALAGHVAAIGPLTAEQFSDVPPDNVTGNYTKVVQRVPVKISINAAGDRLRGQIRPGMSALARIDTGRAAGVRVAR